VPAKKRRTHSPPHPPREKELLLHLRRHRITTLEVLKRLHFAKQADSTVRYHVRRIVTAGQLESRKLPSGRTYYHLTPAAARTLGAPRSFGQAPGAQALPRLLGALAYTCLGSEPSLRLLPEELDALYPGLAGKGGLTFEDYCVEADPRAADFRYLTAIKVDAEGADPDAFLRGLRSQLDRGESVPLFGKLRAERLFAVGIVTSEPSKRVAYHRALERRPLGVAVRVATADFPLHRKQPKTRAR
jgi:hypothetical protein